MTMKIPEQTSTSAIIYRDWVFAVRMRRADENREMSNKLWRECSLAPVRRMKFLGALFESLLEHVSRVLGNLSSLYSGVSIAECFLIVKNIFSLSNSILVEKYLNYRSSTVVSHNFSRWILARETSWKASNRLNYSQESFYFENSVFHWRLRNLLGSDRATSFGGFVINFDDCQK